MNPYTMTNIYENMEKEEKKANRSAILLDYCKE